MTRPQPAPVPEPVPASEREVTAGTARLWAVYLGGFMGPFAGALVNSVLPEVAAGLGTDLRTASLGVTAYMVPFALMMLFSGTLADRWGRIRTLRLAFWAFGIASVVCALAPSAPLFLAGRSVAGVANAFTTPLLIAMIADTVPAARLGRALGTFASMQALGQASAPLVGGLAASVDYRWAFVANAAAAVALALATPRSAAAGTAPGSWRALVNSRVLRSASTALCQQFAGTAIMVLGALVAAERFGLAPAPRGALIAVFGVAGLVSGRAFGALTDKVGVLRAGCGALAALSAACLGVGFASHLALLALAIALGGMATTGGRVLTNTLAVNSTPTNRSGATSVTLSAQFTGTAVVPLMLPLYQHSPGAALFVAALVAAVGIAVAGTGRGGRALG